MLLLFTAVLELTTFCVSPLEVCLNSLKLFLFLKEVVSEGLCASLHLVVFTLHFQNSFTALGQLKLQLLGELFACLILILLSIVLF